MLRAARRDASRLVIGIDADAASMREAAGRRSGVANALFVVAAAESLPEELTSIADRATVYFPWGSLLRGLVTGDGPVLANLERVCANGAEVYRPLLDRRA